MGVKERIFGRSKDGVKQTRAWGAEIGGKMSFGGKLGDRDKVGCVKIEFGAEVRFWEMKECFREQR